MDFFLCPKKKEGSNSLLIVILLRLLTSDLFQSVFIPIGMDQYGLFFWFVCFFLNAQRAVNKLGLVFSIDGENTYIWFHCRGNCISFCRDLLIINTSPYYLLLNWVRELISVIHRSNLAWEVKLPKSLVTSSHSS